MTRARPEAVVRLAPDSDDRMRRLGTIRQTSATPARHSSARGHPGDCYATHALVSSTRVLDDSLASVDGESCQTGAGPS